MKIYIAIDVPDNFANSLNMLDVIKEEIFVKDNWSWHLGRPNKVVTSAFVEANKDYDL